jgi:hypothetical protein
MAIPTRSRLPTIRKGDVITASPFLNGIVNQLNRGLDDFKPPRQVDEGLNEGEETASDKSLMTLVVEGTDTLLCTNPAGNLALVAKPPKIRGDLATRTVNGEAQIIIPVYTLGDLIFAEKGWDGGTGATDAAGLPVDYLDTNPDGRYWAEDD